MQFTEMQKPFKTEWFCSVATVAWPWQAASADFGEQIGGVVSASCISWPSRSEEKRTSYEIYEHLHTLSHLLRSEA